MADEIKPEDKDQPKEPHLCLCFTDDGRSALPEGISSEEKLPLARILFALLTIFEESTMGLPIEEIATRAGLKLEQLRSLNLLINKGIVSSCVCQVGTAGPFAARFKFDPKIKVTISVDPR